MNSNLAHVLHISVQVPYLKLEMDYRSFVNGRTRIMFRELTNGVGRLPSCLALGLTLIFASQPLAAVEEIIVDGAKEAAQIRAYQAFFESQMEVYGKTVSVEFKDLVNAELKNLVSSEAYLTVISPNRSLLTAIAR